jgi:hypothetical protein
VGVLWDFLFICVLDDVGFLVHLCAAAVWISCLFIEDFPMQLL